MNDKKYLQFDYEMAVSKKSDDLSNFTEEKYKDYEEELQLEIKACLIKKSMFYDQLVVDIWVRSICSIPFILDVLEMITDKRFYKDISQTFLRNTEILDVKEESRIFFELKRNKLKQSAAVEEMKKHQEYIDKMTKKEIEEKKRIDKEKRDDLSKIFKIMIDEFHERTGYIRPKNNLERNGNLDGKDITINKSQWTDTIKRYYDDI